MSDTKSSLSMLGWGSVAALAAFVASTHLSPQAFDLVRPADRQGLASAPVVDSDISARLWEDPFMALRRYDVERPKRCEQERASRQVSGDCSAKAHDARQPEALLKRLDVDANGDWADSLVVISLVPGDDFVGGEEARRRLRYATLAGLMAQGYVPDRPERLSLLEFRGLSPVLSALAPTPAVAASAPLPFPSAQSTWESISRLVESIKKSGPGVTVPYEILSQAPGMRDAARGNARYARVAVLWLDESSLPKAKFDTLARLLELSLGDEVRRRHRDAMKSGAAGASTRPVWQAVPADSDPAAPALAVIGPSSTDALRTAIADLRCALVRTSAATGTADTAECLARASGAPDLAVRDGYRLLAGATFYNAASTAPPHLIAELQGQPLETFVPEHLRRIGGATPPKPAQVIRTIATDDVLIDALVDELKLRLPPDKPRRIVVVAERDSLYSRGLIKELRRRLDASKQRQLLLDEVYFFRGLDGAELRDSGDKPAKPAANDPAAKTPELPEGRDQLDYLRRVGQALAQSQARPGAVPIGAIGVLANDVHDKLMILQALHEEFPDKPFFTTDLDARFLHPKVQRYTRNLIVAGSLPLAFPPAPGASGAQTLQDGTPPLRDAYQTATYLAARHAGCADDVCRDREAAALKAVVSDPSVYEIGRERAVPLGGHAYSLHGPSGSMGDVSAAAVMGALIVLGVLGWPSTPSLLRARAAFLGGGTAGGERLDMNTVVLGTLQVAAMAFVIASLIEFARPDEVNFAHMLWLGSLGGFACMLAMLPALLAGYGRAGGAPPPAAGINALHLALLLGAVALWTWMAWPAGRSAGPACTECEPVAWFQGISAWPSHLLHLLAVVVTVGAFDRAWSGTRHALQDDSDWLRMPEQPAPVLRRFTLQRLLRYWLAHFSVLFWRRQGGFSCDAGRLWEEYRWRCHGQARALRLLCWFLLTVGLVALTFFSLSEGQVPEIPVRGTQHRQMVGATLYALLLLVPLLIVAVADATVTLLVFVRHLNEGRSWYPPDTLAQFASSLGATNRAAWLDRIAALPESRGQGGIGPWQHTLLDPWIDVQVVARRSRQVAGLVFWPFLVLALLVVARSRAFDNWSLTPAVATGVSLYVGMLVALTLLLKRACEQTRQRALEAMRADLRWLEGGDATQRGLVVPFQRLIADVETNQVGAFAPFLDQPLLKSLLVPLGGASVTPLFELLVSPR